MDIHVIRKHGRFNLNARFTVPDHGITAIFGRSGSGKTTLIQCIAGVQRPDDGRIAIDDAVLFDRAGRIDVPIEQRGVGMVFQDARLFPHLNVLRNLRYGMERAHGRPHRVALGPVIELLGLDHLLDRKPARLSGGERQRVALGRALLSQPRVLLLDEPLAALDAQRKAEILPYLEKLRDEFSLPMLYVTHALDEVIRLCDTMVLLSDGDVKATGKITDILSRADLQPFVGRFEAGSVIDCTVASHDISFAMSTLTFDGGSLRIPLVNLPEGAPVRARIRTRDVSLALTEPQGISISNRLPCTIAGMRESDGPYMDIELALGQACHLRALITRESCARLQLREGLGVWALIKAVSMDKRSLGGGRPVASDDASSTR